VILDSLVKLGKFPVLGKNAISFYDPSSYMMADCPAYRSKTAMNGRDPTPPGKNS